MSHRDGTNTTNGEASAPRPLASLTLGHADPWVTLTLGLAASPNTALGTTQTQSRLPKADEPVSACGVGKSNSRQSRGRHQERSSIQLLFL